MVEVKVQEERLTDQLAAVEPSQDSIEAKAAQKQDYIQRFIRKVERALHVRTDEDWNWLSDVCNPEDPLFRTLVTLFLSSKYASFTVLMCTVLRAMQMVLRFAVYKETKRVSGGDMSWIDPNVGMSCFRSLTGEALAQQAVPQMIQLAFQVRMTGEAHEEDEERLEEEAENVLAHNALLVLAELGPEVTSDNLSTPMATRLLNSFQSLGDRADELVEVALRMHAWGDKHRKALLIVTVSHPGRTLLGEVLIQVVNKCEAERRHRAIKVLKSCLMMPGTENLLYTNDARVLVEILLRELPSQVKDEAAFADHVDCFKVLAWRCEVAREHRRDELVRLMTELSEDEENPPGVRAKSAEVLSLLADRLPGKPPRRVSSNQRGSADYVGSHLMLPPQRPSS